MCNFLKRFFLNDFKQGSCGKFYSFWAFWATLTWILTKFKNFPSASFDFLNRCAKFQDHILTGNAINTEFTRPLRFHVWECLIYQKNHTSKIDYEKMRDFSLSMNYNYQSCDKKGLMDFLSDIFRQNPSKSLEYVKNVTW